MTQTLPGERRDQLHLTSDPYEILEVQPHARKDVIKAAYRVLSREYHPDRNTSSSATNDMQRINDAYSILCDDEKREAYDYAHGYKMDFEREETFREKLSAFWVVLSISCKWLGMAAAGYLIAFLLITFSISNAQVLGWPILKAFVQMFAGIILAYLTTKMTTTTIKMMAQLLLGELLQYLRRKPRFTR